MTTHQEKVAQLVGLAKYASGRAVRMRKCGAGDAECCRQRWYNQAATYVDQRKFYMEQARAVVGKQNRFVYVVEDDIFGEGGPVLVAAISKEEARDLANQDLGRKLFCNWPRFFCACLRAFFNCLFAAFCALLRVSWVVSMPLERTSWVFDMPDCSLSCTAEAVERTTCFAFSARLLPFN